MVSASACQFVKFKCDWKTFRKWFLWTKLMYLELFTSLYMSQEQTALLAFPLSTSLPLCLFALLWGHWQSPHWGGGGKIGAERWEMWADSQRPSELEKKRRREGRGCLKRMRLWTTTPSHSIESSWSWETEGGQSIEPNTLRLLKIMFYCEFEFIVEAVYFETTLTTFFKTC